MYDQDGQIAYFDTIDNHGCLKVEQLVLTVGEYQVPPVQYQYECYAQGTEPAWTWDKTGITYHEDTYDEIILPDPNGGCDIKHRLDLRFHEEYYHEENKVACEEYYWPVTGATYHESQNGIMRTFHNAFGDTFCDSTFVLKSTLSKQPNSPFPTRRIVTATCGILKAMNTRQMITTLRITILQSRIPIQGHTRIFRAATVL